MFKTRLVTSSIILIIISLSLLLFGGIPFRFVFGFALICAFAEIGFSRTRLGVVNFRQDLLASSQILCLIGGFAFFCIFAPIRACIIVLVSVCATDTFAYIFGKTFGGKIIATRPFPKTSPKKSWEGIIAGIVGSACATPIIIYLMDGFSFDKMQTYEYWYLTSGVLAVLGDYLESALKRSMYVKDSIDFVGQDNRILLFFERALGGKNGHGGYLDRLDSTAFAGSVFLILFSVLCKL